jgi:amidohydrolase
MDAFTLTILGKAAHAGMPDEGVDAILISSYLISALQSLISKETSPLAQLVVHVGTIRGGDAFNVVAGQVQLKGTIRTLDDGLRKSCPERMDRIARGIVEALRGKHQLEYKALYPTTINDKAMTAFVLNQAKRVVGSSNVMRFAPIMASDDIGFFLQKVPGCFMFVGSSNAEKGYIQPAHSPLFDFDEDSLLIGTEILIRTALAYLMGTSFLVGNEVNGSTGTDTTH